LGAGASISSGIPSAGSCIWQWKKSIFCTRNPGLEEQVGELSLPSVQERIDTWLNANGFRPSTGESEYGYFIEKCLPITDNRREFFAEWIRRSRPHLGYKLLCMLAEEEVLQSVWTTNFDGLVARAASDFSITPIEISIDSGERVYRQPKRGELPCVSLHGDYRYDPLKNTDSELQEQDERLRQSLGETLRTHSLIAFGYSGRDDSVMKALRDGLSEQGSGKVFWCGFGDEPSREVEELLLHARVRGREAFYVPGVSFDDAMVRLSLHCLEGNGLQAARRLIGSTVESQRPPRVAFRSTSGKETSIIKSNAWPLRVPGEMFQFGLKKWPDDHVWKWLSEITEGHEVIAVPFRNVLAFGTLDGIRDVFGDLIDGEISRVPITEADTRYEDGAVASLLRRSLIRAIAAKRKLHADGQRRVWETTSLKREREGKKSFEVYNAARLELRRIGGDLFLSVDPTYHCDGDPVADAEAIRAITMRLLGYQHNQEFNTALNYWRETLLEKQAPTEFDFPAGTASFKFTVQSAPVFASVQQPGKKAVTIPDNLRRLVRHTGIEIAEPKLRFGQNEASRSDTLPIRGLAESGPFDQALSGTILDDRIQLGVICPQAESQMLEAFLDGVRRTHEPQRGDREEYMVAYPGFSNAFRCGLVTPNPGDAAWRVLPEVNTEASDGDGSKQLFQSIRDEIATLGATGRRLILVFTPDRWRRFRRFETENEVFDVHDWVKAYCVKQGIATQFLDQDTLGYPDKCRIWWWLSVALYAKSMRSPWVLDGLDSGTAFVGLGYAINRRAQAGKHIVLGCSHLYNSQGHGLQFRLSRIENPIVSGGTPFLSFDDARRIGETIRTLFWEAKLSLPNRVVIHKLTPFRKDEQKGLGAGLEGVRELELIEINHEPSLRYISSMVDAKGFKDSMFPVRRGTALPLSDHEALMWIHGAADSVKPNWTYFQGKRRIPAPVVLRRYAGRSDLATLCSELLGLSKMDWNSGDLYSKLPATVVSSKHIAKIGVLLDRFGETSYDYRLFM